MVTAGQTTKKTGLSPSPPLPSPRGLAARGERAIALGPFLVFALFVGALFIVRPDIASAVIKIIPLHALPMGSESSVAFLVFQGIPVTVLFVFLVIFDLATSMPFLAFTDALQKVPFVGALVTRTQSKGNAFYVRHQWMRRLGPIGLVLFVAVPLSGTGTAMGIFMGRLAGFSTYLIAAVVALGTFVRWFFVVGAVKMASWVF